MSNSVTLKFEYKNTDFTRTYKLDNVATSALASVKSAVNNINQNLSDPYDSEMNKQLSAVFVADTYDNQPRGDGHLYRIAEATIVVEEVTKIPLF